MDSSFGKKLLIGMHQLSLADGGAGLKPLHFPRSLLKARGFHSQRDGTGTDQYDLFFHFDKPEDLAAQPLKISLGEMTFRRGKNARTGLDHYSMTLLQEFTHV